MLRRGSRKTRIGGIMERIACRGIRVWSEYISLSDSRYYTVATEYVGVIKPHNRILFIT